MPAETPSTAAELALSTAGLGGAQKDYTPNLMPFHIEHDGPAPVSTYMKVESVKRGVGKPEGEAEEEGSTGEERYVSTFRGRRIHGVDVRLPSGYSGLVLRSGPAGEGKRGGPGETEGGGMVRAEGGFSTVRVWGADVGVDGGRDEYVRALGEWAAVAGVVHGWER